MNAHPAKRWNRLLAAGLTLLLVIIIAACSPSVATRAPSEGQKPGQAATQAAPAAEGPAVEEPAQEAGSQATQASAAPTMPAAPTQTAQSAPEEIIEGRVVELEWPASVRMGDSDIVRMALVPTKDGYAVEAEFPDHSIQSKPVPVPRPNGYELYAIARLDSVGFDISPTGDQEHFIPEGEEVAWRWSLSPRAPGQQRISVVLRLRWAPGPGVSGPVRESQAFARGLDIQVRSFLGLSTAQAGSAGVVGLLAGCGLLLAAGAGARKAAPPKRVQPGALAITQPNPELHIETPPGLALDSEESGLLQGLFGSYSRLVIENEFLSGYSGARTFLVRPIRADGVADAPTIVKLGPREAIWEEYANYEAFVKDRLPPMTARIQRAPVTLGSSKAAIRKRAAVQYTFIAEPGHPPISLRRALLAEPDPALLVRLFETFGPSWWMQRRPYTFAMGVEYDRLLPPHCVLEPAPGARQLSAAPVTIDENQNPADLRLAAGDIVSLRPFRRVELRADGRTFSMAGIAPAGHPPLRVRWIGATLPGRAVLARVSATRLDLLRGWTANFDRFGLPDPFERLPAILAERVSGAHSVIHGDLNLENVLAGPGSLVWLIDFAQTREGHPLFDFAHLESELIAHVLAPRLGSAQAYLEQWQRADDPLLGAVHEMARRCLFDPAQHREYNLALYLACLGALKYQNLTPLAKHCLYLTAASLCETPIHL